MRAFFYFLGVGLFSWTVLGLELEERNPQATTLPPLTSQTLAASTTNSLILTSTTLQNTTPSNPDSTSTATNCPEDETCTGGQTTTDSSSGNSSAASSVHNSVETSAMTMTRDRGTLEASATATSSIQVTGYDVLTGQRGSAGRIEFGGMGVWVGLIGGIVAWLI